LQRHPVRRKIRIVEIPETRYSRSEDGVHIAYQVLGDSDLDLIVSPGFVSHLEHSREEPHMARFFRRLASFSRLIVFDKRGTGMSDRSVDENAPLLEDRVNDIATLMDTVGSERAAIMGLSETARWRSCSPPPTRREREPWWPTDRSLGKAARVRSIHGSPTRKPLSGWRNWSRTADGRARHPAEHPCPHAPPPQAR
jgi:hypothetical protein